VLRWQLAPHLSADVTGEHSVLIRDDGGRVVATIFLRGAAPVRVVARDVSLRFGQRVAASCLELPTGAALEALTIVAPAGPDGPVVSFSVDEQLPEQGVVWTDALGRHRLLVGAGPSPPLPGNVVANVDLTWCAEGAAADQDGAVIAALPPVPLHLPGDKQCTTHEWEQSGRMIVMAHTHGRWEQLDVVEPRRG
jgi:hypothetical protein